MTQNDFEGKSRQEAEGSNSQQASEAPGKHAVEVRVLQNQFPNMPPHEIRNFMEHYEDLQVARAKIEACLEWRKQNLPIKPEDVVQPLRQGMFYFHGQDKDGHPVAYFTLRGHSRHKRSIEQYIKSVVYQSEELIKARGGSDYQIVVVIDRKGTNFANQDLDMFKAFFKVFAEVYPNKMHSVIVYPAATMARAVWALIRPFLHSRVEKRVVMASSLSDVLAIIPKEQLVSSLGGDDPFVYQSPV